MIQKQAHIIKRLKSGIIQLRKLGGKKTIWVNRRTSKVLNIRKKQLTLLFDLLEIEDNEFNTLWNRNMDLLSGEHLKFRVSKIEGGIMNNHPAKLTGKMDKTGKIIAMPSGVTYPFMRKQIFPKKYIGMINGIGELRLNASSHGMSFFSRVLPIEYIGSISSNGTISIDISKRKNVILVYSNMARIVCNPFIKDEDRLAFLKNKDNIMRKAAQRLKNIEDQEVFD